MNAFLLSFSIATFLGVCLFLLLFRVMHFKHHGDGVERLSVGAGSLLPGFIGCFLQTILLIHLLWDDNGYVNLGISNAFLVCTFIITLLSLIITLFIPIVQIVVVFLPINIIAVILSVIASSTQSTILLPTASLQAHILLSLSAYSVLAFSSLVAILFACKDWQVKHHRFGILWQTLPSLFAKLGASTVLHIIHWLCIIERWHSDRLY